MAKLHFYSIDINDSYDAEKLEQLSFFPQFKMDARELIGQRLCIDIQRIQNNELTNRVKEAMTAGFVVHCFDEGIA